MKKDYEIKGSILRIRMPQELDHHAAEEIRVTADRIVERQNIRKIVFDFCDTEFMDSSGIGVIMGRYRNIRLVGGSVSAVNLGERIARILKISGLERFIKVEQEKNWDRKGVYYGEHE